MNAVTFSVIVIAVLILVQAVFVAAEMALVSLRESQVKQLSGRGQRGAAVASLAADPNRFLSTVSIGITVCTLLSGAFGGDTPALAMEPWLVSLGLPEGIARGVAIALVTLLIAFVSIVIGELVAKRLAMQRAASFALALAPLVNAVSVFSRPLIWLLGKATDGVMRLLGGDPHTARMQVTGEELRAMVSSSVSLGIQEKVIVDEVFAAGQVSLREVMVPRTEATFLEGSMPAHKAIREIQEGSYSRYPVIGRDVDEVLGFIHVRDLFDLDPAQRSAPIAQLARPIGTLPATVKILTALADMQASKQHMVIVSDEYGGTAGIVTIEDLVEEIVGDITDEFDNPASTPKAVDGNLPAEVDGLLTLEDFEQRFSLPLLDGPYDTVAGFVMARLGHLPSVGDTVTVASTAGSDTPAEPVVLTVLELDGRRASKLRVERPAPAPETA